MSDRAIIIAAWERFLAAGGCWAKLTRPILKLPRAIPEAQSDPEVNGEPANQTGGVVTITQHKVSQDGELVPQLVGKLGDTVVILDGPGAYSSKDST